MGNAISPPGDMPKHRVQVSVSKDASCRQTPRSPLTSYFVRSDRPKACRPMSIASCGRGPCAPSRTAMPRHGTLGVLSQSGLRLGERLPFSRPQAAGSRSPGGPRRRQCLRSKTRWSRPAPRPSSSPRARCVRTSTNHATCSPTSMLTAPRCRPPVSNAIANTGSKCFEKARAESFLPQRDRFHPMPS
jgi:hypothetical protein